MAVGGAVTDTGIFYSILVFLLVSTSLMFSAGIGDNQADRFPVQGQQEGQGNTLVEKQEKEEDKSFTSTLFSCASESVIGALLGLAFCATVAIADTFIGGVITTLVNYFVFVFRLMLLDLSPEVPGILVLFVYYPAIIMLGWLGYRNIRGTSS
jgi:hypothetical protein